MQGSADGQDLSPESLCLDFCDGFVFVEGEEVGYVLVFQACSLEGARELSDVKVVW